MTRNAFYVTTAIAYPNGAPHIGHAYEMITTDAIARWARLEGRETFFLTGTDEHGIKMVQTAAGLGMTPLVETHSAAELDVALEIGARLVGVNARDLSTFELDRDLFGRLAPTIPDGVVKVAESAVLAPADVAHYRASGADVVLIGEALVTGDPVATLHDFLEVG